MNREMKRILFLCSGNYYRSRFAEHLFNWLAEQESLCWGAESRGLIVDRSNNVGPISTNALDALTTLGIFGPADSRFPIQLAHTDLIDADLIVALKEAEHRGMIAERFPLWTDRVEYWHIDDLDCADPGEALPVLEKSVRELVKRLRTQEAKTAA